MFAERLCAVTTTSCSCASCAAAFALSSPMPAQHAAMRKYARQLITNDPFIFAFPLIAAMPVEHHEFCPTTVNDGFGRCADLRPGRLRLFFTGLACSRISASTRAPSPRSIAPTMK